MWIWSAYKFHELQHKVHIPQHSVQDPSFSEPRHKSQAHHSLFCTWTPCSNLTKLSSFLLLCTLLTLIKTPFGLLVSQQSGIISTRTIWPFSIPVHTSCHIHQVSFLSTIHDELLNTNYRPGTMLTSGHLKLPSQTLWSRGKEKKIDRCQGTGTAAPNYQSFPSSKGLSLLSNGSVLGCEGLDREKINL